jgi:predicted HicB family RNase H-like nuclease
MNYLQKRRGRSSSLVSSECGGETMMEYKSYAAGPIDFDPEDKTFSGTVAGLRDVIHFEGRTAKELERAFCESIDRYLELCAENGQ